MTIENSSWVYFVLNLLSWIRICIQKHYWIRIRKKWMLIHSPDCFPGVPDCSCHFLHYWAVFCLVVRYLILGYYWYYRYLYGNFSPLISETVVDFFLISRFSSNRSVFLEGYFCVKFIAFLEFGVRVPHQTCVLWLHLFLSESQILSWLIYLLYLYFEVVPRYRYLYILSRFPDIL